MANKPLYIKKLESQIEQLISLVEKNKKLDDKIYIVQVDILNELNKIHILLLESKEPEKGFLEKIFDKLTTKR